MRSRLSRSFYTSSCDRAQSCDGQPPQSGAAAAAAASSAAHRQRQKQRGASVDTDAVRVTSRDFTAADINAATRRGTNAENSAAAAVTTKTLAQTPENTKAHRKKRSRLCVTL